MTSRDLFENLVALTGLKSFVLLSLFPTVFQMSDCRFLSTESIQHEHEQGHVKQGQGPKRAAK